MEWECVACGHVDDADEFDDPDFVDEANPEFSGAMVCPQCGAVEM